MTPRTLQSRTIAYYLYLDLHLVLWHARQSPLEFRLSKPTKSTTQTSLPVSLESDAPTPSDLPQDFETALSQLEELVTKMESGVLPLEESLIAYRRGVALTRICQERLAQAEQQISVVEAGLLRPFDAVDRQVE